MATLRTNTVSGIGTEGTVFNGGLHFDSQNYMVLPKGTLNERDNDGGGRAVFGGGEVPASPGTTNTIDYVEFSSSAIVSPNFGDLTVARRKLASASSSTRGIFAGGATPSATDVIDFITILSTGNATDFGNLLSNSDDSSQCFGGGNNTRGIFAGGYNDVNVIQYITNASTGNATDFGDLLTGRFDHAGFASPTRAFFAGGKNTPASPDTQVNIEFVTIATTGNGTVFGDMITATRGPTGAASNTRGLMATSASGTNNIEFITMATSGNSKRFGDLTTSRGEILAGGTSNNVRAIFAGGGTTDIIDQVKIASEGNAIDFGNLSESRSNTAAVSNAHGGLS